jgi:hypothetical protein
VTILSIRAEDFLIWTAIFCAAVLLWSWRRLAPAPAPAEKPKPPEPTRWRRFRVSAAAIASGTEGAVVEEIPEGLVLRLVDGDATELPISFGKDADSVVLWIERQRFSWKPHIVARWKGAPWVRILTKPGNGFPVFEAMDPPPTDALPLAGLDFHGSLSLREFEIRSGGRLVASVTREVEDEPVEGAYFVEIVKSFDPMPLVALALVLEVCAVRQGCAFAPLEKT